MLFISILIAAGAAGPARAVLAGRADVPARERACRIDRVDAAGRTLYSGSGVVLDSRTVLTARHVIGFASARIARLRIVTASGTLEMPAPVRPKPAVDGPDAAILRLPREAAEFNRALVIPRDAADSARLLAGAARVFAIGFGGTRRPRFDELRAVVREHHPDFAPAAVERRAEALDRVFDARHDRRRHRALRHAGLTPADVEMLDDDLLELTQPVDATGVELQKMPYEDAGSVLVPIAAERVILRADLGGPVIGTNADGDECVLGIVAAGRYRILELPRFRPWLAADALPRTGRRALDLYRRLNLPLTNHAREIAVVEVIPPHAVLPAHVYDLAECEASFTARPN